MSSNSKLLSNSSPDKVIEIIFSPNASLGFVSAFRVFTSISSKFAVDHRGITFRAKKRITRSFHRNIGVHPEVPKFNSFILVIVSRLCSISELKPYRFIIDHIAPPLHRRNKTDHCSYEIHHKGVDHIFSPESVLFWFRSHNITFWRIIFNTNLQGGNEI